MSCLRLLLQWERPQQRQVLREQWPPGGSGGGSAAEVRGGCRARQVQGGPQDAILRKSKEAFHKMAAEQR